MSSSKPFGITNPQLEQLQGAGILNLKFTVWVIYTHSEKITGRKRRQKGNLTGFLLSNRKLACEFFTTAM